MDGRFELADATPLVLPGSVADSEKEAATRFCRACERVARRRVDLRVGGEPKSRRTSEPCIGVRIDENGTPTGPKEAYRLVVRPDRVAIRARDGAGLFYALQTLTQLVRSAGASWPCLEIEDDPALPMRGLHLDVSRGRVPTLETLKGLVERLAHLKINQLQLYVEHTFAFAFDPDISENCSPLTADEIREFDAFCKLHRIELVPSLASFGHMARILSLPQYRHLAEIASDKGWEAISWADRTRGLTLDATNPASRKLLERMYDEFMPPFSSGWVNVCCDETYDLGRGKGKARGDEIGVGRLYLEHLCWLHDLCARYGKRMMFWGDVMRKHPDLLAELPRDCRVMHWDYGRHAEYETTKVFCDAGLDTVVCPATSAWARFMSGISVADANIRAHAEAARRYGASGLLNTEWGDEGCVNMLAASWHPIALGAAVSWNVDQPEPEAFDRAFDRLMFGPDVRRESGSVSSALRNLGRLHDDVTDWRVLRAAFDDTAAHEPVTTDNARRVIEDAQALRKLLDTLPAARAAEGENLCDDLLIAPIEVEELRVAARMCELVGEKVLLARALTGSSFRPDAQLRDRLGRFSDRLARCMDAFAGAWSARNKPSELQTVLKAMRRVCDEAKQLASAR